MANLAYTWHTIAVHPPLRSTISATRCVCNGLQNEHFKGTGYCVHCASQCTTYRPATSGGLAWLPSYE